MKVLKCKFEKVRKAEYVVKDLKFHFEWKNAKYALNKEGEPIVNYTTKDGEKKTAELLYVDDIFNEYGEMETFDECFDYTFSVWGKDEKGNWCLGYED